MRFRKRTKLFPGVRLNFSKSGISTTIGMPGANINFGKNGTYLNTGVPGTGIYNRKKIGGEKKGNKDDVFPDNPLNPLKNEEIGAIKTEEAESTTTEGLQHLKKTLLNCYQERRELKKEIKKVRLWLILATVLLGVSYILIIGFFIKWFKENRKEKKDYLDDLKSQLENCFINIDMQIDEEIEKKYHHLSENYKSVLSCLKIWDITSSIAINRKKTRSAASSSVTRRPVKFGFHNIDIIKSKYDALHFENANGGDIYIYPAFIAIVDAKKKFGLVDIRELNFNFHGQRFLEEEKVPQDAKVVGQTWAKVNKDGSRDKRFKDNYRIPICLYGEIKLSSDTGLNEAYSLSNYDKAERFSNSMINYQNTIK